jgi:hypothetical protein
MNKEQLYLCLGVDRTRLFLLAPVVCFLSLFCDMLRCLKERMCEFGLFGGSGPHENCQAGKNRMSAGGDGNKTLAQW